LAKSRVAITPKRSRFYARWACSDLRESIEGVIVVFAVNCQPVNGQSCIAQRHDRTSGFLNRARDAARDGGRETHCQRQEWRHYAEDSSYGNSPWEERCPIYAVS